MKLSLVAIHHNAPEKFERLVNSMGKLPEGIELVMIDDCSEDWAKKKLRKFADAMFSFCESDMSFYWMTDWKGPGGARNQGAKMAAGEWVWFLDGDDELMPGAVDRLLKTLEETDAPIVVIDNETVHPDGRVEQVKIADNAYCLSLWQVGVMAWQKVIRREYLSPFRENCFGEDMDWWINQIMAFPKGCQYATVQGGPLYRYFYAGDGSVTEAVNAIRSGDVSSCEGLASLVSAGKESMLMALRKAAAEAVRRNMPEAFASHIEFMIRQIGENIK